MVAGQPINTVPPLIAIVGQTATGKSGLALALAEHFGGEIVCADSRTIYKGMDIGTAKPTQDERSRIPHHCLDLVSPGERFTAADFKQHAEQAITNITGRGKVPILVGGTGLYIDAVLYDYTFQGPADVVLRAELMALSIPELQERLIRETIPLPSNPQNPRHLIRALETKGVAPPRHEIRSNSLILGVQLDREELLPQVVNRITSMMRDGLQQEVQHLAKRYGFAVSQMQTIGYQEWRENFNGVQTLQHTKQLIINNTMAYAKRQKTWFKRNNSVHWLSYRDRLTQSVDLTTTFLSK